MTVGSCAVDLGHYTIAKVSQSQRCAKDRCRVENETIILSRVWWHFPLNCFQDIKGSSESVQEFAARINKLGTQIFQSGNSAQNTAVRNANDQLLQSRFISGLRNDIRRFVLSRDPLNVDESISASLIEEQNMKLNQIANDERSGLSPHKRKIRSFQH
ncbi:hypothetical protein TNCV_4842281 [Trichonephila clavipes]|uniref:Uncharacterized protein n=1 Tax=Trichonephila clavipes TaxID=2585209 RepID=A0A8X7BLT7_TRICX|nr:hypothetical protein TNCV_4842281 [Trichonephila clavipes]